MQIEGARCWLVGASSGLGAALARELDAAGAVVAVSARRQERLDELTAGTGMTPVAVDVTDAESVRTGFERVRSALGGLDVLVYCAGTWQVSDVRDWDQGSFEQHVSTNLLGLGQCLDVTLPTLREQRRGAVVGIASVAAYRGVPGADYYGPTKAAVVNLLEALRASLRTDGVRVMSVLPGFLRSEMTDAADFPQPFKITAEDAAARIVRGMRQDRTVLVFPRRMRALMTGARMVPAAIWPRLTPVLRLPWVRRL